MQSKLLLGVLALIAITTVGLYNYTSNNQDLGNLVNTQECPEQNYRSEESFQKFYSNIQKKSMSNDKIKVIKSEVGNDPRVFSTSQVLQLIKVVGMTSDKCIILDIIDKYIPYLTTNELISIINEIGFSSEKLTVLESLANTLIDLNEQTKTQIVNLFGMSSDKNKAKSILDNARARDCIFGSVTENVAHFVIDISHSMAYKFKTNDGQEISRLDFVKEHLSNTIEEQLRDYQRFNIFTLHRGSDKWQSDNVPATKENIQSALKFIKGLNTKDYTNLSYPLEQAFKTSQQLEAVYLLTDGVPNHGIQKVDEMKTFVQNLISSRNPAVKIHTISFMLGGTETSNEREIAQQYLETIAHTSGGSFKTFQ